MALYNFDQLTYVIIHGDGGYLDFSEMEPGTALVTPHTVETFTDEALAKARAEELGYDFTEPELP